MQRPDKSACIAFHSAHCGSSPHQSSKHQVDKRCFGESIPCKPSRKKRLACGGLEIGEHDLLSTLKASTLGGWPLVIYNPQLVPSKAPPCSRQLQSQGIKYRSYPSKMSSLVAAPLLPINPDHREAVEPASGSKIVLPSGCAAALIEPDVSAPFSAICKLFDRLRCNPADADALNVTYPKRGIYKTIAINNGISDQ